MKRQYVLITTAHRGVFAGFLEEEKDNGRTVVLTKAKNAIRFGTNRGFLELANQGPSESSKIGSEADEITLYDVTSKAVCSSVAQTNWEIA